jgi:hypothetical protein
MLGSSMESRATNFVFTGKSSNRMALNYGITTTHIRDCKMPNILSLERCQKNKIGGR